MGQTRAQRKAKEVGFAAVVIVGGIFVVALVADAVFNPKPPPAPQSVSALTDAAVDAGHHHAASHRAHPYDGSSHHHP